VPAIGIGGSPARLTGLWSAARVSAGLTIFGRVKV